MKAKESGTSETDRSFLRAAMSTTNVFALLACALVAFFHANVHEDRLLLNLYYVSLAGLLYAFLRRAAYAQFAFVSTLVAGTTISHVYSAASRVSMDPLIDPVIDSVSLTVLLLLCWRLASGASRFDADRRRFEHEKLVERTAVRSRAAALTATSHEVRNPLSAILSLTEVLIDDGDLNEMQKEFVTDIDECGRHLLTLINDILDFARTEAGQISLQKESVALEGLVKQCLSISEALHSKKPLRISAQISPNVEEVYGDPLRLKQIILNLLSNAIKYSPENGVVKVQVRDVNSHVHIAVRDSGPGIEPEKLKHLFDPYYQAAHSDQSIGTGLGLAITKHLVELHGGEIQAESVVGSGTMFVVKIPVGSVHGHREANDNDEVVKWTDVFGDEELVAAGVADKPAYYQTDTVVVDVD